MTGTETRPLSQHMGMISRFMLSIMPCKLSFSKELKLPKFSPLYGSILKPKHLTEIQDITVDDAQVEEVEGNPECKHVSCSVLLSLFYFRSGLTLT